MISTEDLIDAALALYEPYADERTDWWVHHGGADLGYGCLERMTSGVFTYRLVEYMRRQYPPLDDPRNLMALMTWATLDWTEEKYAFATRERRYDTEQMHLAYLSWVWENIHKLASEYKP